MATTAVSNVELVEKMYADFNAGDIESVRASMADDITWVEPETEPTSPGEHRGVDTVMEQVFAPLVEEYEEFTATPERFVDGGDTVVVLGHFTIKAPGRDALDIPFAHVCDLKDGKLQAFSSHTDTVLVREALGK